MDHFSTDRLTAEILREDHLADIVALHLDAEVSRYLAACDRPRSRRRRVRRARRNPAHPAGRVDEIEIAYTSKREFWGQGLGSEIATALTDIGLSRLKFPSLIGLIFVAHGASRRVLEKSNYVLEKSTRHHGEDVVI
nr:GNAT family N-acetyltransferase [Bradyrhizobium diazoefficiens]